MDHLDAAQELQCRRLLARRLVLPSAPRRAAAAPAAREPIATTVVVVVIVTVIVALLLGRGVVDRLERQGLFQVLDPLEDHDLARLALEDVFQACVGAMRWGTDTGSHQRLFGKERPLTHHAVI